MKRVKATSRSWKICRVRLTQEGELNDKREKSKKLQDEIEKLTKKLDKLKEDASEKSKGYESDMRYYTSRLDEYARELDTIVKTQEDLQQRLKLYEVRLDASPRKPDFLWIA